MSRTSKKEFWQSNINEYRSSGLTAENWCQTHNLSVSTLRYWITKIKKESLFQDVDITPAFAKVDIKELSSFSLGGSSPVTIRLGSLEISVSNHCHPELLSNLIDILTAYA
jgi:hypothetical protein